MLVPAHLGSPGQRAVKRVCVCVFTLLQLARSHQNESVIYLSSRRGCRHYVFTLFVCLCVRDHRAEALPAYR